MKAVIKGLCAVILIILGGAAAYIGITGPEFLKGDKVRCTAETTATVIELEKHTSTKSKKHGKTVTYAPIYEYVVDGTKYTNVGEVAANPAKEKVGDKITIHYDPDSPGKCYYSDTTKLYRIIYGAVGGAFLLIGGIIVITIIKKKR